MFFAICQIQTPRLSLCVTTEEYGPARQRQATRFITGVYTSMDQGCFTHAVRFTASIAPGQKEDQPTSFPL